MSQFTLVIYIRPPSSLLICRDRFLQWMKNDRKSNIISFQNMSLMEQRKENQALSLMPMFKGQHQSPSSEFIIVLMCLIDPNLRTNLRTWLVAALQSCISAMGDKVTASKKTWRSSHQRKARRKTDAGAVNPIVLFFTVLLASAATSPEMVD